MKLTDEILTTIKRLSQNEWQADSETVLALVEEVRRLRTELATMKADGAPATEAPAVDTEPTVSDEIKVGDKVRVTSGMHEGLTGTVSTAPGKKRSLIMRPDNGEMSISFPLFKIEKL